MKFEKLSEKQAEIIKFISEPDDTLICDGAVRSGKTVVMIMAFVIWAMTHFENTNFAICGKTVGNVEKNVLRPLFEIEGLPYTFSYRRSDSMLAVNCGGIKNNFYVYGGKDESSYMLIQGITLAGVFFDEVALMPRSFVEQAISRTLTFDNSKLWFNCNPDSPSHWFYEGYIAEIPPGAKRLHFLMEDNPIMTEEKIKKAKSKFTGVFYDRYVNGLWVVAQGLVYKVFDEGKNIEEVSPTDGMWYISMDYGTLNPCSMGLWCVKDGIAHRVDEYYYDGRKKGVQKTDEDYYGELEKLAGDRNIQCLVIDPSAASFIATVRRHGRFAVRKAKNDVIPGINATATLISDGKVIINRKCSDILREFKTYRFDENAPCDRVIKENDHAMDDMRYFCYTILERMR